MISKFWSYISNVGITEDISPSEAKRYVLLNQFIVLAMMFTGFYSFLFAYYGYQKAVGSDIFFILTYFILWIISKEKYAKLARFLFLIIINFQVYIACLIFGEESQIYLIYGPIATVPIVLYEFKQKSMIFLFALFTVILLIDLFKINFGSVLHIPISVNTAQKFRLTSIIVAIICEVIVVYALVISANEVELKLGKTNVFLEDQFKTIFNNSSDALFLVDFQSRAILKANKRAVELFEMEQESDFFLFEGSDFHKNKFSEDELAHMRKEVVVKGFLKMKPYIYLIKEKSFGVLLL